MKAHIEFDCGHSCNISTVEGSNQVLMDDDHLDVSPLWLTAVSCVEAAEVFLHKSQENNGDEQTVAVAYVRIASALLLAALEAGKGWEHA